MTRIGMSRRVRQLSRTRSTRGTNLKRQPLVSATCFYALFLLFGTQAAAVAQPVDVELVTASVHIDSGLVENTGTDQEVVYSTTIHIPDAPWLRLEFDDVVLSGDVGSGTESYLIITSQEDGAYQYLNAVHVAQWRNTSAYFNGDMVTIDLIAHAGTGPNRLRMSEVRIDEIGVGDRDICGPNDDRVLSDDVRVGRLRPFGGTARIHDDCKHCLLTAGHCFYPDNNVNDTVEFNVPLSDADGNLNHPPSEDQYSIDPSSIQKQYVEDTPAGDDWAYFGCFPNSNTGLTPAEAQGDWFILTTPPAVGGQDIRITGYGRVDPPVSATWDRVQKTHAGPYVTFSGTLVEYQTDTTSWNSGSPVILDGTNHAIGIHTNAGCDTVGNKGTGSNHPDLQAALASPLGVCLYAERGEYHCPYSVYLHGVDHSYITGEYEEPFPSGGHGVRMSKESGECTVYYRFILPHPPSGQNFEKYIRDGSLKIGVESRDWAFWWWLGPTFAIKDNVTGTYENFCTNCGSQDELMWHAWSPPTTDSNRYVNDAGEVWLRFHVPWDRHTVVDDVLISFEAADELLSSVEIADTLDDCCGDGQPDGVEVQFDADVGSPGDGLTVQVTADVELFPPGGGAVVDSETLTWTITDQQSEPQTATLSAPCETGANGPYKVRIELRDEPGNVEATWTQSQWVYLYPVCATGGACCYANGACGEVGGAGDCSGEYQGDGTTCSPSPCPQPQGACCYSDGSCEDVVGEAYCTGDYQGDGNFCATVDCPYCGNGVVESGEQCDPPDGLICDSNCQLIAGAGVVVNPYGSGDYPTIQGAVDAVSDGMEVLLTDGTFTGYGNRDIDYHGKAITVRSQSDNPEACIIDCQGSESDPHRGFYFHSDEGGGSILRGVTITNGHEDDSPGSAIRCSGSEPTIENCILSNNTSSNSGAAWYANTGTIEINDCVFTGNTGRGLYLATPQLARLINCTFHANSGSIGGAIRASCQAYLRLTDCTLTDNTASAWGGAIYNGSGALECTNCLIHGNSTLGSGGAIVHNTSTDSATFTGCVLSNNHAQASGGAIWAEGAAVLTNCTLAANSAPSGGGVSCSSATLAKTIIAISTEGEAIDCGSAMVDCCDIYGNAGGDYVGCIAGQDLINDNISQDPLLCNPYTGGCYLDSGSPCLPSQQPECGLIGALDVGCWPGDCNGNGSPDGDDIAGGTSKDCDTNGAPDECDLGRGTSPDCNGNSFPDECDVSAGTSDDCQPDTVPDECQLAGNDCNGNEVPDECDIVVGTSQDCQTDGIPDECQLQNNDCNQNSTPDQCDIAAGTSEDGNGNGVPDECEQWELAKLGAIDGDGGDALGESVAICGDALIVGAQGEDDNGGNAGAAYVFRFDGTKWTQEAKFLANDGVSGDYFGYSVDISGNTAVIGAIADEDNGRLSGSAYVFVFDGASWIQRAKLLASDGMAGHRLGVSVAIVDDTVVAGADGQGGSPGGDHEAVYVFERPPAGWQNMTETAKLTASDDASQFGFCVATASDTVLVGAPGAEAAYVFDRPPSGWEDMTETHILLPADPGPPPGIGFGWSVGLSGEIAVIGATDDDTCGDASGAAYVFRFNGSSWEQEAKLTASDCETNAVFGRAATVSSGVMIIGAPWDNVSGDNAGAAYVFRFDGLNWVEEVKLSASDAATQDEFSYGVSIDNYTAAIGAPHKGNGVSGEVGFVYVFAGLCDCNTNGVLDISDIVDRTSQDCQPNGLPDECDVDPSDPDGNGTVSQDCQTNGVPDECELLWNDCNSNGVPDECDIAGGPSLDVDPANDCPDECDWTDCNSNGLPDFWDVYQGTSQDSNANCVPDDCEAVEILAVRSCQTHGVAGTFCLEVGQGGVEPRLGRVTRLEVDLGDTLDPASVKDEHVQVACDAHVYDGNVAASLSGGTTVILDFDMPLPNQDCCRIGLAGMRSDRGHIVIDTCPVALLEGDANRDGYINTADASSLKQRLGQLVDAANAQYDVNRDGFISTADSSSVKSRLGNIAPTCP